ncbi:MAG: helix-turn-helix domain-containing protein [Deferribacteraceae bacterium]|jgi:predicted DNA-binding transcriptional regulator AlpA|nr:helix-turn-helix domain-containing protein [Deferribacteraceae bacterium]
MFNVLRVKDAAQFLGISKSTFWRWVQQGSIPQGIHLSPRVTVWRREVLEGVLNRFEDGGAVCHK